MQSPHRLRNSVLHGQAIVIWRPKPNTRIQLRYRKEMRAIMPHLQTGVVITSGGKKIVNTLIKLDDGTFVVVPRGNLFELK